MTYMVEARGLRKQYGDPNLDGEDPRRMANRKASLPSLVRSMLFSMIGVVLVTSQ